MRERISKLVNKWTIGVLAVMLVAVFYVGAVKAESFTYGPMTYTVSKYGYIIITDCDENATGVLEIPEEIDGYPVKVIEKEAFRDCSSLIKVEFPKSLVTVETYAFRNCTSLTDVIIPSSIKTLSGQAFYNCSNLQNVYINDLSAWCNMTVSIGTGSSPMYYASKLYLNDELLRGEVILPEGITSVANYAFKGCVDLTSVVVPEGVTSIGRFAFYGCTGLTSIKMPDSVTEVGECMFKECTSLSNVILSEKITTIENEFFEKCISLENIMIPESVECIEYHAFYECSSLKSIEIPVGVTKLGGNVFSKCYSLTEVQIPKGIEELEYTFSDCTGLTSFVIPEGVNSIRGVFSGCTNLTSVEIPSSLREMENNAFYQCTNLQNVYINDLKAWCNMSVDTTTGAHPMNYATNLYMNNELLSGELVIPAGTTKICNQSFMGQKDITSVIIPEGVTSIGDSAFRNCNSLLSIKIPDGITSIEGGVFLNCGSLTSIEIPEGVTSIGSAAFRGCVDLTSVVVPEGVTSIGNLAFYGCSGLTTITIPKGVTSIGSSAFYGCSGLTTITIPKGVTSIESSTFYGCSGLTAITIPEGVTSIGSSAFNGCSGLTMISIPKGITSISNNAFSRCKNIVLRVNSAYAKQYAIDNGLAYVVVPKFIQVITMPNKVDYCLNEQFNPEGIVLKIVYSDDTEDVITKDFQLSGFDSSKVGTSTIHVKYDDFETSFDVAIHDKHQYDNDSDMICNRCEYERTVNKIEILTMPSKTEYCLNKELNITGLTVKVTYSDDTTKILTDGYQITGFDSSKAGTYDVVISYGGKTVSYKVTVNEKHTYSNDEDMSCGVCDYIRVLERIEIQTMPTKLTYKQDEELDLTGFTLKAIYSDGTTKELSEGYDVNGFSSVNAGECKITISYKGQTTFFNITIEKYVATELHLNNTEITEKKGTVIQLTATCTPSLPSAEKIVWSSSDESVAIVDQDGKVTTLAGGTVIITAAVGGKQVTCTITVLEGEWVKDSKGYWYKQYDGSYPHSEWKVIDGNKYYFNASGYRATGWAAIEGKWYYFNADGLLVKNQWVGVYYTDENGMMMTNAWVDNGKYYVDASGAYVATSGWFQLNGKYYYLSGGLKQTGWISSGGVWYYMDTKTGIMLANEWLDNTYYFQGSGAMATGWLSINGNYYYFEGSGAKVTNRWVGNYYLKDSGIMATNEVINGYYVGADGATVNGWKLIDGEYYYYAGGLKKLGWFNDGGTWYYMDTKTGVMYADEWLDNIYYFKSSGAMAVGWTMINGNQYYFDGSGAKVANRWVGSYYMKSNGIMAANEWVDGGKYYVDITGAYVSSTGWFALKGDYYYLVGGAKQTGWLQSGGVWYYLAPSTGVMYANQWLNNTYYFQGSGAMATGWVTIAGYDYCFDSSGAKMTSQWIGDYYVDADGKWLEGYPKSVNIGTCPSLDVGETYAVSINLKPTNANAKYVVWTSSNESVATVENGVIKAVGPGTAIITATVNGVSDTCSVRVKEVSVSSITLDITSKQLAAGESFTLHATVNPSNATHSGITWTSSDNDIASVENGVVTGKAQGTVTITAKAGNKSAKCTVVVTAEPLSLNETWTVAGKWRFTITGIETHTKCNPIEDKVGDQVVIIHYKYYNDGYIGIESQPGLYFGMANFSVYDKNGAKGTTYACSHDQHASQAAIGTYCTASIAYILPAKSDRIRVDMTHIKGVEPSNNYAATYNIEMPYVKLKDTPSVATLAPGDVLQAAIETNCPNDVTWASSDTSVASVDNTGKIVAKRPGVAIIDVYAGGAYGTLLVEVHALEIEVLTALNVSTNKLELRITNKTNSDIKLEGYGSKVQNGSDKYMLYNINGKDDGIVTIPAHSTVTVTLKFPTYYPSGLSFKLNDSSKIYLYYTWNNSECVVLRSMNGSHTEMIAQ